MNRIALTSAVPSDDQFEEVFPIRNCRSLGGERMSVSFKCKESMKPRVRINGWIIKAYPSRSLWFRLSVVAETATTQRSQA